MTEIDLAALQRQLEERAAANWDQEEIALLARPGPPRRRRPAPAEIDLVVLQREAEVRALAFWDENEAPLINTFTPARPIGEALFNAIEEAADDWLNYGRRVTPYFEGTYADYLKTDHWLALRQRMLLRAGRLCRRCKKTSLRLDVHHIDYRHLGAERESDLIVLCRECHEAEHREED